jgi:hypothetical protein
MERSKGYAVMFLLGAFVAGGALGFTADRVIDVDRAHTDKEWRRSSSSLQRSRHLLIR